MPQPASDLPRVVEEFRALPVDDDRRRAIVAELGTDDTAVEAASFLASVVADPHEYDLARVEAATILRLWPPPDPVTARTVARALLAALDDPDEDLVRQYAVHALGSYADDPTVHETLAAAVLDNGQDGDSAGDDADSGEDVLVRYNALAALEEAGPSDARAGILRALARDPELGRSAVRVLTSWGRTPDGPA
ncbi:hypothetical protein ACFYYY_15325 [Streptomyces sp. NPDC001834]|uniref:hypothetical protein n=1 Tax=Streptomyces sp. NPDC001834 TaxID=3364616 RepID=UPI00369D185C